MLSETDKKFSEAEVVSECELGVQRGRWLQNLLNDLQGHRTSSFVELSQAHVVLLMHSIWCLGKDPLRKDGSSEGSLIPPRSPSGNSSTYCPAVAVLSHADWSLLLSTPNVDTDPTRYNYWVEIGSYLLVSSLRSEIQDGHNCEKGGRARTTAEHLRS